MLLKLIFIFVTLPLIDLLFLLWIADFLGIVKTIILVLLTGLIGASLAKREGLMTYKRFKRKIREKRSPSEELINGALVLLGAAFLLTPGLITDSFGFLLLFPFSRNKFKKFIKKRFNQKIETKQVIVSNSKRK